MLDTLLELRPLLARSAWPAAFVLLLAVLLAVLPAACTSTPTPTPHGPVSLEPADALPVAGPPEWFLQVPPPASGRIYYTGQGRGRDGLDQPGAEQAARQAAQTNVASSVMSRVHSSLDQVVRSETVQDNRFFDRFVSSRVETDAQGTVWDLREEKRHWDLAGGTSYLLVSVPEAVINPSPEAQRAAWRRQAENLTAEGNLAGALPLARAVCMLGATEPEARLYLSILESLERWDEASRFAEKWARENPGATPSVGSPPGLAATLAGGELERYRERAAALAGEVTWDWFHERLELLRGMGYHPELLNAALNRASAAAGSAAERVPQLDQAGRPSELPVSVRTLHSRFLVVAYEDAEGLEFLYEHRDVAGERPLPRRVWNHTLPLRAGTVKGPCAVWIWATDQPVTLPAAAVYKLQLDGKHPDAAGKARGLAETLRNLVTSGGACVRVDFEIY